MKFAANIKGILLTLSVLLWSSTGFAATLSGTVFGGSTPLANVGVAIYLQGEDAAMVEVITDVNGLYSAEISATGTYNLIFSPPIDSGYSNNVVNDLVISTANITQNVVLIDGASILNGIVRDGHGNPISNIQLTVNDLVSGTAMGTVYSDINGAYSLSLANGSYEIDIRNGSTSNQPSPSYFLIWPFIHSLTVAGDTTQNVDLPFITLSGKTTDANGVAVAGVEVKADDYWSDTSSGEYEFRKVITSTLSDANGDYSLVVLAGLGGITLTPPSGSILAITAINDLTLTVDATRNFVLNTASILSGIVRDGHGNPISAIQLTVNDLVSGTAIGTVYSDVNGAYSLSLANGSYEIDIRNGSTSNQPSPSYFLIWPFIHSLTVAGDTTQNVDLPFITLSGKTSDANGVAVAGVEVKADDYWSDTSSGPYEFRKVITSTLSDANGDYLLVVLAGLDAETITPPTGSGFAITAINGLNLQADILQNIILPFNDVVAPKIISGPHISDITDTTATVTWQTDEPATSVISGDVSRTLTGVRTEHAVFLTGLTANTGYTIKAESTDVSANGPVLSDPISFTTANAADVIAPSIIQGPVINAIGHNSAVIEWMTSEPATSTTDYGITTAFGTRLNDTAYLESHRVELTGLNALTMYYFKVNGSDIAGNGTSSSQTLNFTTLATPDITAPVIINGPLALNVTDTEATIVWETDEISVSGVSYNDGTVYGVVTDEQLLNKHQVQLTHLSPATQYFMTVSSTDALGNGPSLSESLSFNTQSLADSTPPTITNSPKVVGITHQSAMILWKTDESSDSVIRYGLSADQLNSVESNVKLKRQHTVQLVNLNGLTEYFAQVESTDSAGNVTSSVVFSFTTRSIPDNKAPVFTALPAIIKTTNKTMTVYWETDEPSDSVIYYGLGQNTNLQRSNAAMTKKHQITLVNLDPGKSYSFIVRSTDTAGNVAEYSSLVSVSSASFWTDKMESLLLAMVGISDAHAETTQISSGAGFSTSTIADEVIPVITNVSAIPLGNSMVLVNWLTDEPTDSRVAYGLSSTMDLFSGDEIKYSTHSVLLTNLTPNTVYHYVVSGQDIVGNTSASGELTFTTGSVNDTSAPLFTVSPSVASDNSDNFVLEWTTNEFTTAVISYGYLQDDLRLQTADITIGATHHILLREVLPALTYYIQVEAFDVYGNSKKSSIITHTSSGAPMDSDGDGISDALEVLALTNPYDSRSFTSTNIDSDNDGMDDDWEIKHGLDPSDAGDALLDADNDGITNLAEFNAHSNPRVNEATVAIQPVLQLLNDRKKAFPRMPAYLIPHAK